MRTDHPESRPNGLDPRVQSADRPPIASLVLVTYNSADHLRPCLESIRNQPGFEDYEIIVVDNASTDESVDYVRSSCPEARVIANAGNLGFAAACNQAWAVARGDYLVLVNPDSVLGDDCLPAALRYMDQHPLCGLSGGKLVDLEGKAAPSARRFPNALDKLTTLSGLAARWPGNRFWGRADYSWFDHERVLEVDWVPGAFTVIRAETLRQTGFFDERFFLYYEETDLCRRIREAGWAVTFLPECEVIHEGGGSSRQHESGDFDSAGSQIRSFRLYAECLYHRKHGGFWGVLTNLGVEWLWHRLRGGMHRISRKGSDGKRRYSLALTQAIERALARTRWGSFSPDKPWVS